MGKRYDPQEAEPRIQAFWNQQQTYRFDTSSDKEVFSIDTPPPTLSGRMHLGHAFSYAQGDFIARYKRMRGYVVLYPFGTDDNGLPTERLVEKQQNVSSAHMSREEFVDIVNESVKNSVKEFSADWKRLGISADFDNAYSTINDHCIKTSQKSFIDLYKKGLVTRKADPVSWCPRCQTAIAQAEFENIDKQSHMNTIVFETVSGKELEIMTTRPELIPACVTLAAHPDDKRYKDLVDEEIKIPLVDSFDTYFDSSTVSLIFDESVDQDKGSGLMMVCTFGDKEDVEKWRKHELDSKFIIGSDGKMTKHAGPYAGMKIVEARKAILNDLKEAGHLKSQKALTHATNVHERCSTPIEYIKHLQWFVNVLDYKEELLDAGRDINWYPSHMRSRFEHWVNGLNWDWIISRQRSYGVPFPVFYDEDGGVVLADESDLPIDPLSPPKKYAGLTPETDVLDTWATSSLTPQIVLDWANTDEFSSMSLRLQAHDIIRTWAFYTITKAHHHHGSTPWEDIVISGHGLDSKGRKMSKSKGNVVDPNEMMRKYSADAVRFWAATTKLGEDLPFQEKDLVTAKKTITKLYNASKFASMHLKDYDGNVPEFELEVFDRWLISKFNRVIKEATDSLDEYEYNKARSAIDSFFWNDFCDNYLELSKNRLYNPDVRGEDSRLSAQFCLYEVLLGQLKLLAPIMPHITEELYQNYFVDSQSAHSIHVSSWPSALDQFDDEDAYEASEILIDFLSQARKYKSDRQMSMRSEIPHATLTIPFKYKMLIEEAMLDWQATSGVVDVDIQEGESSIEFSS